MDTNVTARPEPTRVTRTELDATAARLKNWGKWGPDDQVGTLNYTTADDIVQAAKLVRKGQVISLALNYDKDGPQGGKTKFPPVGRFNPVHTMLRSGSDAYSGTLDKRGIRSADDMVLFPLQAGTHWDGLGHIFFDNHMWNGYDCREVSSFGAAKAGIHFTKEKMVGRGVLLDIPRHLGLDWLPEGYAIKNDLLDACCASQGVSVGRGDHLLVRTGQMEQCLAAGSWDGYPGGDAPGLDFETLDWLQAKQVSARGDGHLGCGGAAEQHGRHQPALALDLHSHHGADDGRNLQAGRARAGVRSGQGIRFPVRRPCPADHRRCRLPPQPDRDTLS